MSFKSSYYKDKEKFREHREKWKTGYRVRTGAFKWKSRWSSSDIKKVLEHSVPDRVLSEEICHSVSAIQKKRWEIKKNNVEV